MNNVPTVASQNRHENDNSTETAEHAMEVDTEPCNSDSNENEITGENESSHECDNIDVDDDVSIKGKS